MGSRSRIVLVALIALASVVDVHAGEVTPPSSPVQSEAVGIGIGGKSNANAVGIGGTGGRGGNAHAVGEGGAGGSAQASQEQAATSDATATGGSSNQTQQASANNQGNALSVTSNYRERLQAPSVSAPAVFASGTCTFGWSAGLSIPGGGITGGKARPDTNCDRREAARILMGINPALALKVLCSDPYVAAVATGDDCMYAVPARAEVDQSRAYATREELERLRQDSATALERAFKKNQSK